MVFNHRPAGDSLRGAACPQVKGGELIPKGGRKAERKGTLFFISVNLFPVVLCWDFTFSFFISESSIKASPRTTRVGSTFFFFLLNNVFYFSNIIARDVSLYTSRDCKVPPFICILLKRVILTEPGK